MRLQRTSAVLLLMVVCLAGQPASAVGKKRNYKKWLREEVLWIISSRERDRFKELNKDEEREAFVEQFWKRRDPTPTTERNEYQEEHYRRLQVASEKFQEGTPGWKTDRGHVYILHGPPDEQSFFRSRNVDTLGRDIPSGEQNQDSIVWTYHQIPYADFYRGEVVVVFQPQVGLSRQSFQLGESRTAREKADEMAKKLNITAPPVTADVRYQLVTAGPPALVNARGAELPQTGGGDLARYVGDLLRSPGDRLEEMAAEKERQNEARQEMIGAVATDVVFGALTVDARCRGFYRRGEEWLVPVEIAAPAENLSGRVDLLAALVDEQGAVFDEFLETVTLEGQSKAMLRYANRFSAPSGNYTLRVVLREVDGRHGGLAEVPLTLDEAAPESVKIGSVLLTDRVEMPTGDARLQAGPEGLIFNNIRLLANRSGHFRADGNLFIYAQLWSPSGARSLTLTGALMRDGAVVGNLEDYRFENADRFSEYATVIPLSAFEPGEYRLRLHVQDHASGQRVSRDIPFKVEG